MAEEGLIKFTNPKMIVNGSAEEVEEITAQVNEATANCKEVTENLHDLDVALCNFEIELNKHNKIKAAVKKRMQGLATKM